MRYRFILSIAVTLGALSVGCAKSTTTAETGAAPTSGNDQAGHQALSHLEDEWAKALETHDTAFFVRAVAPDFHGTADSATFGRAELIKDASDTAAVIRDMQDNDRQIRIYGHGTVGVVTGHSTWTLEKGQRPGQYSGRYTETWVKQPNGQWQAVAGPYSMVPPSGQSQ
jgi:ketosteroid isomerase-like protein